MYLKPRFYLQDKTCLSFLNLFTLLNRTFSSSTFSQIISVILGQWKSIVCSFYLSICLEMGIKTASQFCKKSECVNISHIGLEYPFLGLLQGAFSRVTMSESSVSVSKVLCLRRACSRIPESTLLPALSFHMNFSYLLWRFFFKGGSKSQSRDYKKHESRDCLSGTWSKLHQMSQGKDSISDC